MTQKEIEKKLIGEFSRYWHLQHIAPYYVVVTVGETSKSWITTNRSENPDDSKVLDVLSFFRERWQAMQPHDLDAKLEIIYVGTGSVKHDHLAIELKNRYK